MTVMCCLCGKETERADAHFIETKEVEGSIYNFYICIGCHGVLGAKCNELHGLKGR